MNHSSSERSAVRRTSLAIVSTMVAFVAAVAAGPTLAARSSAQATTVRTTMKEFKFVLSTKTVRKGTVTFRLRNTGRLPHDFKIAGKKSKLIAPGKTGLLTVTFRKAGSYAYLCTVAGHAAAGMKGKLRVT
jgi:plastocyanin